MTTPNPANVLSGIFSDALSVLTDALYISYIMQGAPHGRTDEGFQRWLDEQAEADDDHAQPSH